MSQDILAQAQNGDAKAIELIMNHTTRHRGIRTRVAYQADCLHILLESGRSLDQQKMTTFVQDSMKQLQITTVPSLKVYGRQQGAKNVDWTSEILLEDWLAPGSDASPSTLEQATETTSFLEEEVTELAADTDTSVNGVAAIASDLDFIAEPMDPDEISTIIDPDGGDAGFEDFSAFDADPNEIATVIDPEEMDFSEESTIDHGAADNVGNSDNLDSMDGWWAIAPSSNFSDDLSLGESGFGASLSNIEFTSGHDDTLEEFGDISPDLNPFQFGAVEDFSEAAIATENFTESVAAEDQETDEDSFADLMGIAPVEQSDRIPQTQDELAEANELDDVAQNTATFQPIDDPLESWENTEDDDIEVDDMPSDEELEAVLFPNGDLLSPDFIDEFEQGGAVADVTETSEDLGDLLSMENTPTQSQSVDDDLSELLLDEVDSTSTASQDLDDLLQESEDEYEEAIAVDDSNIQAVDSLFAVEESIGEDIAQDLGIFSIEESVLGEELDQVDNIDLSSESEEDFIDEGFGWQVEEIAPEEPDQELDSLFAAEEPVEPGEDWQLKLEAIATDEPDQELEDFFAEEEPIVEEADWQLEAIASDEPDQELEDFFAEEEPIVEEADWQLEAIASDETEEELDNLFSADEEPIVEESDWHLKAIASDEPEEELDSLLSIEEEPIVEEEEPIVEEADWQLEAIASDEPEEELDSLLSIDEESIAEPDQELDSLFAEEEPIIEEADWQLEAIATDEPDQELEDFFAEEEPIVEESDWHLEAIASDEPDQELDNLFSADEEPIAEEADWQLEAIASDEPEEELDNLFAEEESVAEESDWALNAIASDEAEEELDDLFSSAGEEEPPVSTGDSWEDILPNESEAAYSPDDIEAALFSNDPSIETWAISNNALGRIPVSETDDAILPETEDQDIVSLIVDELQTQTDAPSPIPEAPNLPSPEPDSLHLQKADALEELGQKLVELSRDESQEDGGDALSGRLPLGDLPLGDLFDPPPNDEDLINVLESETEDIFPVSNEYDDDLNFLPVPSALLNTPDDATDELNQLAEVLETEEAGDRPSNFDAETGLLEFDVLATNSDVNSSDSGKILEPIDEKNPFSFSSDDDPLSPETITQDITVGDLTAPSESSIDVPNTPDFFDGNSADILEDFEIADEANALSLNNPIDDVPDTSDFLDNSSVDLPDNSETSDEADTQSVDSSIDSIDMISSLSSLIVPEQKSFIDPQVDSQGEIEEAILEVSLDPELDAGEGQAPEIQGQEDQRDRLDEGNVAKDNITADLVASDLSAPNALVVDLPPVADPISPPDLPPEWEEEDEKSSWQASFTRPESVVLLIFVGVMLLWQMFLSLIEDAAPDGSLSAHELARRLQVSHGLINRLKQQPDFPELSKALDPKGISWVYAEGVFWPILSFLTDEAADDVEEAQENTTTEIASQD